MGEAGLLAVSSPRKSFIPIVALFCVLLVVCLYTFASREQGSLASTYGHGPSSCSDSCSLSNSLKESENKLNLTATRIRNWLHHKEWEHWLNRSNNTDHFSHCNAPKPATFSRRIITPLNPAIDKNCSKLYLGDAEEVRHVQNELSHWESDTSDAEYMIQLTNCSYVREEFLNNYYVSQVEEEFPIAYIVVVYVDPLQILRFLKAVYRPHNVYCIHPDSKSGLEFALHFHLLSKCLGNVFVASKLSNVFYGSGASTLEAQINCYSDLVQLSMEWRYVINLCGRDLPLRTNREIVEVLLSLNGSSAIVPYKVNKRFMKRFSNSKVCAKCRTTKVRPPHGITLYKSSSYNALAREFVEFFITNQTSIDFYHWIYNARIPEEHFYASLYMLPEAPQGNSSYNSSDIVAVKWGEKYNDKTFRDCAGKLVHRVCIITIGDLPMVSASANNRMATVLFYNKYFMEDDHIVMDCMEENLIQKNKIEYRNDCSHNIRRQFGYV